MNELVTYAVASLALGVAGFSGIKMWKRQLVNNALFYAAAVVEITLIALLIGGCIALAQTTRDVDGVLFVSYLVTLVVIPPAAVVWGVAEKSRWGTGVVVVAMLSVAVLCFRVLGIWQGHYV
ncbi:MAG: hypothetical protein JJE02_03895 [Propionibacteriales bacterium]|nr:hypothetical protein [Propionibacteriales bacterium]